MAPNLALMAIPAYYVAVYYPAAVAARMIFDRDPAAYDNANPRGSAARAAYRDLLGPQRFAKWERSRAANANGYESFPMVAATILTGLYVGLPQRTMDIAGWALVALRVCFNALYMHTESQQKSLFRSANFYTEMFTCIGVFVTAALRSSGS